MQNSFPMSNSIHTKSPTSKMHSLIKISRSMPMASFSTASKALIVAVFVILLSSEGLIGRAGAAGECGETPIQSAALVLTPCLGAVKDPRAKVAAACCSKVAAMFNTSPKCLCAILLSPVAKQAGINPAIAITIPKRCNIRNRPAGKKCGKYTLP